MAYMRDKRGVRLDGIAVPSAPDLGAGVTLAPPSYATTATKPFDPMRSLYNSRCASFLKARAAIAATQVGGRGQILAIGHSHLAGANATPGTSDTISALTKLLRGRLGGGVSNAIAPMRNNQIRDSRYPSVSTLWTLSDSGASTSFATATTAGAWINYTSDAAGTVVDIVTFESSGSFTYAIDGGAAVTVNSTSGNAKVRTISVTGLANTIHTVAITATTTTATYIVGIGVRNTTGLELLNFGYGGAQSGTWSNSAAASSLWQVAHGTAPTPALTVVQLDVNDVRNNIGLVGYKAQMQTVITNAATFGPVMLVLSPFTPGTDGVSAPLWPSYANALYELADSNDVALFDMNHYIGGWAQAVASGINSTDALHLSASGWFHEAQGLAAALS